MKIKDVNLETVCGITSSFPDNDGVEFAFIGRSNVGKSSLINSLLGRKSLARTSAQPGKTQTVNYYKVNNEIYFVDLPGYGYAKVSKEIKEKWLRMTDRYFTTSKMLRVVFQLIDIRHDPTKLDVDMYRKLCGFGFCPLIIATKADKIKKTQINSHADCIKKVLNVIPDTPIIPFSSVTGLGKEEILEYVEEYAVLFSGDD